MSRPGPNYGRIITAGDRVRVTNEAGTEEGTVLAVLLLNRVRVLADSGDEFVVDRNQLIKLNTEDPT